MSSCVAGRKVNCRSQDESLENDAAESKGKETKGRELVRSLTDDVEFGKTCTYMGGIGPRSVKVSRVHVDNGFGFLEPLIH